MPVETLAQAWKIARGQEAPSPSSCFYLSPPARAAKAKAAEPAVRVGSGVAASSRAAPATPDQADHRPPAAATAERRPLLALAEEEEERASESVRPRSPGSLAAVVPAWALMLWASATAVLAAATGALVFALAARPG